MAMHLFSTPVQCAQCGTVVNDPTVDHCPTCHALLKERRTPQRIAGVERRYGSLRFLLGVLRFFGIIMLIVGVMGFLFASGEFTALGGLGILLGSILSAVSLFAVAAMFSVLLDIEENTRASFRLQQHLLDAVQPGRKTARAEPAQTVEPTA